MTSSSTNAVIIRNAVRADLDGLCALETANFQTDLISRASFSRFLRQASARLLVADAGDADQPNIVGYGLLLLHANTDIGRIYSLAIAQDWRGKGLGTQLLAGIENLAIDATCVRMRLEVRADNKPAHNLYIRHGYHKIADLPGYYQDGGDGVRLEHVLYNGQSDISPAVATGAPLILVDRLSDLRFAVSGARIMRVRDYLALDHGVRNRRVINLCQSYEYLSRGYYCSLLAAARAERVIPEADVLLDLNWKRLQKSARAELSPQIIDALAKSGQNAGQAPDHIPDHIDVYFGRTADKRFRQIGERAFDQFRCPILRLHLNAGDRRILREIEAPSLSQLGDSNLAEFEAALRAYLRGRIRKQGNITPPTALVAILHDPDAVLPPSDKEALDNFVQAAADLGAKAELITARDFHHLSEFDALLIRETTALDHHTYRFAKRAVSEGIPVIDDPVSMLRCTNKVYLAELLRTHRIPAPKSAIFDKRRISEIGQQFSFPSVLKVPDGCFSRGVRKVKSPQHLVEIASEMFKNSELLVIQEYVETTFDWRIGVLGGEAIFASRYFMAPGHWQIVKHEDDGKSFEEGGFETVAVEDAPDDIVSTALAAARLMGDGLYGVDVKETPYGPMIIEVNDNPNIDAGVEDAVLGMELYRRIIAHLLGKIARP
ncbi:GNAT family N-acetyltransferase [Thalassospira australica]|uniref:GNAT family N-acetyltransferase n=1 Tax=Thalassospira australica TaxID=1528106 RepID=UPI00068AB3B2|nr:GNAT family N-acetyltransferase [Thalassospira australica]